LGFKGAINLTPTLGLAFGGERIVQFDNQADLGCNYYLLISQAVPFGRSDIGGNNISSNSYPKGTDCYWGPVGAVSIAINDRLSSGAEWFGCGIGA
jgi:hypothetical protein